MAPLTQQQKVANALIEAKGMDYGPRHGDPRQHKGSGFYGPLPARMDQARRQPS